jgi:hypothetical protein
MVSEYYKIGYANGRTGNEKENVISMFTVR